MSSSKRVKRETIDLGISPPQRSDGAECERLRKEVSHKNEVLSFDGSGMGVFGIGGGRG